MFSGKIFGALAGATVLALSATGAFAQAKEKIKVGFIYVGPVGDHGWSYQHDQGRQAIEKAFRRQGRDHLRGERAGGRFRARHRAAGPHRPRPDLHDLLRLHGADPEGRQEVPEHQVRARHRLQARSEPLDLRGEVPRGPLHHRPDRRQDDQVEHHRLCGRLPDPGSGRRHQRLLPRRAIGEPERQDQGRVGQFLVRPGEGRRCRQGAARPGRGHARPAHRQPGADPGRRGPRQVRLRPGLRHGALRARRRS